MSLITIVVVLLCLGVALYLISLIPMDTRIRQAIQAITLLFVVLWILGAAFDIPILRGLRFR